MDTAVAERILAPNWRDGLESEDVLLFDLARPKHLFESVRERSSRIIADGINWSRLTELAIAHVVYPLVYRNLKQCLPDSFGSSADAQEAERKLYGAYHGSLRNGLMLSHSLGLLLRDFENAGIDVLVHKGVVVAEEYYGELQSRVFGDLDLFVQKSDVVRTSKLLRDLRYEEVDPLPANIEDHWTTYWPFQHPHGNAVGFAFDPGKPTQLDVDIQWGLAPHYFTLDMMPGPLWERTRTVKVGEIEVKTFGAEDTIILLCLHGAKHAWTELRQVADISAAIEASPDLDWQIILDRAEAARCSRIVLLACLLASEIMGVELPSLVAGKISQDQNVAGLFARLVQWRFAEPEGRFERLANAMAFHLRVRDRRRDSFGTALYNTGMALRLRNS